MCKDLMQLPLSHSPSLLSAGAKSHVSAASGCVDSFTNRNVKDHTQGVVREIRGAQGSAGGGVGKEGGKPKGGTGNRTNTGSAKT